MATTNLMAQDSTKCRATSKTTGKQCQRPHIPGGAVCIYHGGAAPQVKAKAAQRLAALIDPHLPKIAERIIQGFDAMETKFFQKDGMVTDSKDVVSWSERRAYAETAMRALGIDASGLNKEPAPAIQVNIVHVGR